MNMKNVLLVGTFTMFSFSSVLPALATDYYVSPTGNDTDLGTSTNKPWKTVGQVRSYAWSPGFQPGDNIWFQGGQTFTAGYGDYLYIQSDKSKGTSVSPLTIGSYGTGRATIQANGAHGIFVWVPGSGAVSVGLVVSNLVFKGDGTAANGGKAYGLLVWNSNSGNLGSVVVEDCSFSGFAGDGLLTGRDPGMGMFSSVTVHDCVAYSNAGLAGLSLPSGSGLCVAGASSGLVEHCLAYSNGIANTCAAGPVGIWAYDATGVTIQYCESYGNRTSSGDGDGFDLDGGCQNCVIQYCYSHDNDGAGYLICQYSGARAYTNNTVRYSISENDGRLQYGGFAFYSTGSSGGLQGTQIYGNTVFSSFVPAVHFNGTGGQTGGKMWNNIFVTTNGQALISGSVSTNVVQFQNNCYWSSGGAFNVAGYSSLSAWRAAMSQEMLNGNPVGFQLDPKLVAPGAGGTIGNATNLPSLTAYKLQGTSPLIDRGLNLSTLFGINVGTRDFYTNAIPQCRTYDIGAYESPDSDGDFIPDDWETLCFGGLGVANATSHNDSDGMSDRDEFVAGTDPTNKLSCFAITNVVIQSATNVVLSWPSTEGRKYGVRTDTNLVESGDTLLASNIAAVLPSNVHTCTVNNASVRFFKAVIQESW